jgi:hypothetical protein
VHAAPSWDASEIQLTFLFIRGEEDVDFEGQRWNSLLDVWMDLIDASGRFITVTGTVVALEDITGKDYVQSDPLDLDYLSTRG